MKKFKKIFILTAAMLLFSAQLVSATTIVKPAKKWKYQHVYKVVNVSPNSYLNCRTGPGTNYKTYGCLYPYDVNIVCDGENSDGTWLHMAEKGGQDEAWVCAKYMKRM